MFTAHDLENKKNQHQVISPFQSSTVELLLDSNSQKKYFEADSEEMSLAQKAHVIAMAFPVMPFDY